MSGTRTSRAALYVRANRLFRVALRAIDAVWGGLWLGALRREDLVAVDEAHYRSLDRYASDAHNRSGLFDWEEEVVRDFFPAGGRLLVTAAGGGREVLALARQGWDVDGFECNPALVDHAAALLGGEGIDATVRLLPPDRAPAAGTPYDAAIVGWGSYMHTPGRGRRIAFLRELRGVLRDDAPVLLSFFTAPAGGLRQRVVTSVGNAVRRLRAAERLEPGDDLVPNFVHYFTEEQVAAELAEGGFRMLRFRPQGSRPTDTGFAVARAAPLEHA